MAKVMFSNDKVKDIFENGKLPFEEFQSLMKNRGLGKKIFNSKSEEVNVDNVDAKIRAKFYEVLGVEEGTKGKELRRAFRRHLVDVFEITETVLEDLVNTGWGENPFFNEFVEYKNAAIGEENQFYTEQKVILTVSELAGNHHNLIRQRLGEGTSYSVKTSWYGLKIYAEFERFLSGAIDWPKMIQKVYEALDKKFNDMIYTTLGSVGGQLPVDADLVKNGPIAEATRKTFKALVQKVKSLNRTDVVIMGTQVALSSFYGLNGVSWISEKEKEERYTTGRVGFFDGIRLVEIPQVYDTDLSTELVADDKVYIMPVADNKFIKVFNEGDPQIKEVSDGNTNADKTIEYEYQTKMGIGVVIGRLFGIWNITSEISG